VSGGCRGGLNLREGLHRGVYVDNLTEEVVTSVEQADGVMRTGARNRRVGATAMNRESSRSHSVFTIVLEARDAVDGMARSRTAR
jgi:kinesin family protein 15